MTNVFFYISHVIEYYMGFRFVLHSEKSYAHLDGTSYRYNL